MVDFKNVKTIFFDYDGTLHDSIKIYAPAFKKAYAFLVEEGFAESREWTDQEIGYWLGFNPNEMWLRFMPKLSEDMRKACSKIIGEEMKRLIEQGTPILYEGTVEVLNYLKGKGYHLVFISNCNTNYMNAHRILFHLDDYFEGLFCSGMFNHIPKFEVLSQVIDQYPYEQVIIGDRYSDIEAGIKNNIRTIGCNYGFSVKGELNEASISINDIRELIHIF